MFSRRTNMRYRGPMESRKFQMLESMKLDIKLAEAALNRMKKNVSKLEREVMSGQPEDDSAEIVSRRMDRLEQNISSLERRMDE